MLISYKVHHEQRAMLDRVSLRIENIIIGLDKPCFNQLEVIEYLFDYKTLGVLAYINGSYVIAINSAIKNKRKQTLTLITELKHYIKHRRLQKAIDPEEVEAIGVICLKSTAWRWPRRKGLSHIKYVNTFRYDKEQILSWYYPPSASYGKENMGGVLL